MNADSSTTRWRAPQLHRGIQRMLRKTARAQHRGLATTCIAGLPLALSARAPLALHHDPKSVISLAQCADAESDFASCVEFRTLSSVTCGAFLSDVCYFSLCARALTLCASHLPPVRAHTVLRTMALASQPKKTTLQVRSSFLLFARFFFVCSPFFLVAVKEGGAVQEDSAVVPHAHGMVRRASPRSARRQLHVRSLVLRGRSARCAPRRGGGARLSHGAAAAAPHVRVVPVRCRLLRLPHALHEAARRLFVCAAHCLRRLGASAPRCLRACLRAALDLSTSRPLALTRPCDLCRLVVVSFPPPARALPRQSNPHALAFSTTTGDVVWKIGEHNAKLRPRYSKEGCLAPIATLPPIRLTPNIRAFITERGLNGDFTAAIMAMADCLASHEATQAYMHLYLHDDPSALLEKGTAQKGRPASAQAKSKRGGGGPSGAHWGQAAAAAQAKQRVGGVGSAQGGSQAHAATQARARARARARAPTPWAPVPAATKVKNDYRRVAATRRAVKEATKRIVAVAPSTTIRTYSSASTKMCTPASEGVRALIDAAATEERSAMQTTLWRPWL